MIRTIKGKTVEIIGADSLKSRQVRIRIVSDNRKVWIDKDNLKSDTSRQEINQAVMNVLRKKEGF